MKISVQEVLGALHGAATAELAKTDPQWTPAVLQALARLAPTDACVDPDVFAARRGTGRAAKEHLWDLVISTWPKYTSVRYSYPAYFAAAEAPRLLLVAESEWGDQRSRRENGLAVLDDFVKVLAARAELKVMVFGYFADAGTTPEASSTFAELTGHMSRLIRLSGDNADYVLFGVAWDLHECRDIHLAKGHPSDEHIGF